MHFLGETIERGAKAKLDYRGRSGAISLCILGREKLHFILRFLLASGLEERRNDLLFHDLFLNHVQKLRINFIFPGEKIERGAEVKLNYRRRGSAISLCILGS